MPRLAVGFAVILSGVETLFTPDYELAFITETDRTVMNTILLSSKV